MSIKVLYIDGDGPFGGASRSLYEAITSLPVGEVDPFFLGTHGTAMNVYRKIAVDVSTARGFTKFDNTRYGFYRGMRWLIILREIFYFPFMLSALVKAKLKWGEFDLIHVNEFVYIIPGLIAKLLFQAPLVVHFRALARVSDSSNRTQCLNYIFKKYVDAMIAIDGNVRRTLPGEFSVRIINNSFTPAASNNPEQFVLDCFRSLSSCSLKVGFVGNLHRAKGLFDIVEAAKLIRDYGVDVQFIIIGGLTLQDRGFKAWLLSKLGLSQNARAELLDSIKANGLSDNFLFIGPTMNITYAYDHLDVLLFPSHYDAPGRPVFEAGFSGIPSIVAVDNPSPDTFVHGETGLAIPAKNPISLANAISFFAENPIQRRRMGHNAQKLAFANFDPEINSRKLLHAYMDLLNLPRQA